MAEEEKRFIVETANRCGRLRVEWTFDHFEDAEECLVRYASEKRPGKLFNTETGELLRVIGWD